MNFQDLSEIVKAFVTLNWKTLCHDRPIKINQKDWWNVINLEIKRETSRRWPIINKGLNFIHSNNTWLCTWFRLMTHAHGYKTLVSKDDIISFETSIYPENHAQWRVNFHELLVLTGYTIKKRLFSWQREVMDFNFSDLYLRGLMVFTTHVRLLCCHSCKQHFMGWWGVSSASMHLSSSHIISTLTWVS